MPCETRRAPALRPIETKSTAWRSNGTGIGSRGGAPPHGQPRRRRRSVTAPSSRSATPGREHRVALKRPCLRERSYANTTNLRRDSDVDIAVEWTNTAMVMTWGETAGTSPHPHDAHCDAMDHRESDSRSIIDPVGTSAAARPWLPDARSGRLYLWSGSCRRLAPSTLHHAPVSGFHRCWSAGVAGVRLPGRDDRGRSIVHQRGEQTYNLCGDGLMDRLSGGRWRAGPGRWSAGDPGVCARHSNS
jgi:hypothetical protein